MIDFVIKDNFILTSKEIIALFSVEPVDVILLPEEEQRVFQADIQGLLNSLRDDSIQLIMRTRKETPEDMNKHFRDLTSQNIKLSSQVAESKRGELIQGYVHEISNLLVNNIVPVKEYLIVFKEQTDTSKEVKLVEAIKKMERLISRVSGNFRKAGIEIKQVTNYDTALKQGEQVVIEHNTLEKIIKSFIRL
jgi:hypothetical protein